jgi:pyruvate-formate lyase-activating enzyme
MPAYELISIPDYFLASVQFSSGCPFTCEFCDIPALYGRNPRLKNPEQVVAELDRLRIGGAQSVYFVDDNFIANPKAAADLLPHLVTWQKRHRYPLRIACEATLNIAKNEKTLELMRDAGFVTIFCGIETPEPEALHAMSKSQNLRLPILDAVETINKYGMEVVSGIIIGLDTDTPDSADRIIEFIRASQIPILTINVLYALPKTPLWDRLERTGASATRKGASPTWTFSCPTTPCWACGASASRPPTSPAPSTGAMRISSGTPSGTGRRIRWIPAASRRTMSGAGWASSRGSSGGWACAAATARISGGWPPAHWGGAASRSSCRARW